VRVDEVFSADGRSVRAADITVYVVQRVVAEVHRGSWTRTFPAGPVPGDQPRLDHPSSRWTRHCWTPSRPQCGTAAPSSPGSSARAQSADPYNTPALRLTAKNAGERGNQISPVLAGRSAAVLAAERPPRPRSGDLAEVRPDGHHVTVARLGAGHGAVTVVRGPDEVYTDPASVGAVAALGGSEFVRAEAIDGGGAAAVATTPLAATRARCRGRYCRRRARRGPAVDRRDGGRALGQRVRRRRGRRGDGGPADTAAANSVLTAAGASRWSGWPTPPTMTWPRRAAPESTGGLDAAADHDVGRVPAGADAADGTTLSSTRTSPPT
jgi:hypothetical protein